MTQAHTWSAGQEQAWACCNDLRQLCGHNKGREDAIIAHLLDQNAAMLEALRELRECDVFEECDCAIEGMDAHQCINCRARAILDRIAG
jgi:hypothetical protein